MAKENQSWFLRGMRDGVPIMLGYAAVGFTLGIAARNAGLTAFQAGLASLLNNASAGEKAGFTVIEAGEGYLVMAMMILIANARYLLMSCALSQKLDPSVSVGHRMLIGYDVTDEIFGICVSVDGNLNPFYAYGAMLVALPGWAVGTYLGVRMGSILPARLVSALSVALYGMFIAIIVPPARRSRFVAGLIAASMALSALLTCLSCFQFLSSGMRVILLTVALSAAAAILKPIEEASA